MCQRTPRSRGARREGEEKARVREGVLPFALAFLSFCFCFWQVLRDLNLDCSLSFEMVRAPEHDV